MDAALNCYAKDGIDFVRLGTSIVDPAAPPTNCINHAIRINHMARECSDSNTAGTLSCGYDSFSDGYEVFDNPSFAQCTATVESLNVILADFVNTRRLTSAGVFACSVQGRLLMQTSGSSLDCSTTIELFNEALNLYPVSYTHLTLPTIA